MSQIYLTDPVFYKNGEPGQSAVAGFESQVTRVVRFTFQAPETGATALSFFFDGVSKGAGIDNPLRFAITTDPDSYCNAGANSPYTGSVHISLPNYTAQGQADVRLTPNATYYLWLFPGQNAWGWYYWPHSGTVTTTGVAQGVATVEGELVLGKPLAVTIHSLPEYTHRLNWRFEGFSGVVGTDLGESTQWTPPLHLANAIPNSQSGLCTLTCYSYRDGVQEGQPQTTTFTLSVPPSLAPTVTATVTDISDAWETLGYYVEKVSKLEAAVSTTVFYGAAITATAITLDGKPYTGAALSAGEHTLAVTVTDSRGFTGQWELALTVTAYTPPKLKLTASRCRADGTPDDTGDHALVTLTGAVSQVAGNTATLTLTYGGTAVDIPVEVGAFTETTQIPADPNETLSIKARIQDAIRGATRSMILSIGYATMDFLTGGRGIAFGTVASREGFQCAMDARFLGKLLDPQDRELARRYDLTPVTGMYLTNHYSRVLEVLGAGYLQLRFTCNRNRTAGDTLYTCDIPLEENIPLTDSTGQYSILLTPTGVQASTALPTGTYTFHSILY